MAGPNPCLVSWYQLGSGAEYLSARDEEGTRDEQGGLAEDSEEVPGAMVPVGRTMAACRDAAIHSQRGSLEVCGIRVARARHALIEPVHRHLRKSHPCPEEKGHSRA